MTPPKPPADFAAPERSLWRRSIVALTEIGLWHASDTDPLERYCRACATARLARERTARRVKAGEAGYTALGSMKQLVTHPDVELERRAHLDADHFAQQLGLTPAARRRLGVDAANDDDANDLDSLLARAGRAQVVPINARRHRNAN
jgi:P27 family predicted phage terminase small subunit